MKLAYVLCKWDKPMCSVNVTIQCALGMRPANVPWEWDYPICPWNEIIQCALGMKLSNVFWKGTRQCAL